MTATPPSPTATAYTDADPCPRVEVVVTLAADAATVTITRSAPGIPSSSVRGASRAVVSGAFLVVDHEAPFGVPITYTATAYDASGLASEVSPASSPVQLDVAELWLTDPLVPTTAVVVGATAPSGTVLTRAALTSVTYGMDARVIAVAGSDLPIGVGGARQQPGSVPVEFYTDTAADGDDLRDLLLQAFPVCFRVPASVRFLPPLLYAAIGGVTRSPWDLDAGSDIWQMTVDSVKGPGGNLVISPRTLDDLADEASSLDGLGLLYTDLIDLQRG